MAAIYDRLNDEARRRPKICVLDSLGCAIGDLGGEPIERVRAQLDEFGGSALCSLLGGQTSPDRAAFYNSTLVRYLDFNDSYLAGGETCHPSDNLGAVLASAQYSNQSGRELMAALAVAYQVQCRLSDVASVRAKGFDHTAQLAYSVAAGVSGRSGKPEVGIQFAAGGATSAEELETEGTRDPQWAIDRAKRFLDAGAYMIMIESEGITESVKTWRTDVPGRFEAALGLEKVMLEAADPEVFDWYIKNYGADVNLFVDHSQIVQLQCLRSGIWGTKSLWGRVVTYRGGEGKARRRRRAS